MNNNNYARRTEINVAINGTNVTSDINWRLRDRDYLTSVTQNQHSFVPAPSGADQIRSGMEMHLSGTFIVHG